MYYYITHDGVGLTLTLGFRPKKALMGLHNGDSAGEGQLDPRLTINIRPLSTYYVIAAVIEQKFQGIILRNKKNSKLAVLWG